MTHDLLEALKPCPFCGCLPECDEHYFGESVDFIVIRCKACGISRERRSLQEATEWWNTRALIASLPESNQPPVAEQVQATDLKSGDYAGSNPAGGTVHNAERLREALRPFAAACDHYSGEQDDEYCVDMDSVIALGHLRDARAALAASSPGEQKPVAYLWTTGAGTRVAHLNPPNPADVNTTYQPLYTSPPSAARWDIVWTPELEAARLDLCEFWVGIADDLHEGKVRYPELGRKALETEQALTILGEIAKRPAAVDSNASAEAEFPSWTDEDKAYELGRRDGYELAVQDIDLAIGGDGEFKGSTIPGATIDVPVMKQRVIDRFVANASAEARLREETHLDACREKLSALRERERQKMNAASDRAERAASTGDMTEVSISSTESERHRQAFSVLNAAFAEFDKLYEALSPAVGDEAKPGVMRAAEKAAGTVSGWSASKQQYAERVVGSPSEPPGCPTPGACSCPSDSPDRREIVARIEARARSYDGNAGALYSGAVVAKELRTILSALDGGR